jgi:hypothetical protein
MVSLRAFDTQQQIKGLRDILKDGTIYAFGETIARGMFCPKSDISREMGTDIGFFSGRQG